MCIAEGALKDEVAREYATYKRLAISWDKFKEVVRAQLANHHATHGKLYGQVQGEREPVG